MLVMIEVGYFGKCDHHHPPPGFAHIASPSPSPHKDYTPSNKSSIYHPPTQRQQYVMVCCLPWL